ncbi:MAG: right-handed parallel beta-helix repeat-containing protein [bacterium]
MASLPMADGIYCSAASPRITYCTIWANTALYYGGGIYARNSSLSLENYLIVENVASYGGGAIACTYSSASIIVNCTISENSVNNPNPGGGGIYTENSSPIILIVSCGMTRRMKSL